MTNALRNAGHTVEEYDLLCMPGHKQNLNSVIRAFHPDILGISIRNIDNINYAQSRSYTDACIDLVQMLRKSSSAPIVLGGPGYSLYPKILLEKTGADFGIVGEGEASFPELIEDISLANVSSPSIIYPSKHGGFQHFGTTYRNRDLARFYLEQGGMLNIQTKRGCPLGCAYCTYPRLEGKQYRFREPETVADEIEYLRDHHGMNYFAIADAVFNDERGHFLQVAQELVRRNIAISFTAFLRPAKFTREEVRLLKTAGLHTVEWGTDGSNDTALKGLEKGFLWEDVLSSNDLFSEAGIAGCHFIIAGGPGETPDTIQEGLQNLDRLKQTVVMVSLGVRIIPGTKIHKLALDQGIVNQKEDLLNPVYYFSPYIQASATDQILRKAFNGRIDRVYPMGQNLDKVAAFHAMGYRGPIWNYLIKK